MKCGSCQSPGLRLTGFNQGREQWACVDCGVTTSLLDCELCERRLVRRLVEADHWACEQCAVVKRACSRCHKRWCEEGRDACADCRVVEDGEPVQVS